MSWKKAATSWPSVLAYGLPLGIVLGWMAGKLVVWAMR